MPIPIPRLIPRLIPIAALIFGVACQTEAETGTQTSSANDENPPPDDVTLDTCAPDPATQWVGAGGVITNHSSKASTYFVSVEFVVDNTRYAEGIASSSTVAPGQNVEWSASGLTDTRPGTECRITSVDRVAS